MDEFTAKMLVNDRVVAEAKLRGYPMFLMQCSECGAVFEWDLPVGFDVWLEWEVLGKQPISGLCPKHDMGKASWAEDEDD